MDWDLYRGYLRCGTCLWSKICVASEGFLMPFLSPCPMTSKECAHASVLECTQCDTSICASCICAAGHHTFAAGTCTPCEAGKFSSATGQTSNATCLICETGGYCPEGSAFVVPCDEGKFQTQFGQTSEEVSFDFRYCKLPRTAPTLFKQYLRVTIGRPVLVVSPEHTR